MSLAELSIFVVGINYANEDGSDRRTELGRLAPGDPVELRREPENKHDPDAVAVFSGRGAQVGYLPAAFCKEIGQRMLAEPYAAVFHWLGEQVAAIRIRFGGGEPTLPQDHEPREPGDFFPDADGPMWGA